jgi:putative membrane protein
MRTVAASLALIATLVAVAATPADQSFFQKLGQAGVAEVQAGKLAASKGTSEPVRKFGMMMAEQHGDANKKVEALAKSKGVTMPAAPSQAQTDEYKALQAKQGARFDQEYVASQVKAHQEVADLLKTEIASGQDEATQSLARELLPTVESHLKMAQSLAGDGKPANP